MTAKVQRFRFQARIAAVFYAIVNNFNETLGKRFPWGEWLEDAIDAAVKRLGTIDWIKYAKDDSEFATPEQIQQVFRDREAGEGKGNEPNSVYMTQKHIDLLKGDIVADISRCYPLMEQYVRPGFAAQLLMKWWCQLDAKDGGKQYFTPPNTEAEQDEAADDDGSEAGREGGE